ncbi:MAG: upp [Acidimicrobiia bacterium]|nr:upp [Acidimicrobiia bacterium]
METTVVDHPLAAERLSILRDVETSNALFRQTLDALATMLIYEATRTLAVDVLQVTTPMGTAAGVRLSAAPMLVPILRAGAGMVDAALRLLPTAEVGYVGVSRDEATFAPHEYLAKLPASLAGRPTIVLDPMLATGGSLAHALALLAERGAPQPITCVCVLAAPEGLAHIGRCGIDVRVFTSAIDDHLDERAFIVPGLGDAGDRQFGLW